MWTESTNLFVDHVVNGPIYGLRGLQESLNHDNSKKGGLRFVLLLALYFLPARVPVPGGGGGGDGKVRW